MNKKYMFIDCCRGYAVMMVIVCHVTRAYPELPWRITQVLRTGWHGVQLFFMVSCVTLMMSWQQETTVGPVSWRGFYVRRFLRIAPGYYLAAVAYAVIQSPARFDFGQLALTALFVNGWSPETMPTTTDGWVVVPGGWSVSAEFTFYMLFPLMTLWTTTHRRAVLLFAASLVIAVLANSVASTMLSPQYGEKVVANFLYFWFPNQVPVFAFGIILYYSIIDDGSSWIKWYREICRRKGNAVLTTLAIALVGLSYLPLAQYAGQWPLLLPAYIMYSIVLGMMILAISESKSMLFVNRWVAGIGKVSFSCYLIHFAVIDLLLRSNPELFRTNSMRYESIAAFGFGLMSTMILTILVANFTYNVIELPGIRLSRILSHRFKKL